jgi:hypothetical protein
MASFLLAKSFFAEPKLKGEKRQKKASAIVSTRRNSQMKPAITPGEILLEDYLVPMGISQNVLARAIGINRLGISELVASQNSY